VKEIYSPTQLPLQKEKRKKEIISEAFPTLEDLRITEKKLSFLALTEFVVIMAFLTSIKEQL
jgi:hypothetical protein